MNGSFFNNIRKKRQLFEKYNVLIVLLITVLLLKVLFSCKEGMFPFELSITGIPAQGLSGDVVTMEETGKDLRILVRTPVTGKTLILSPWIETDFFPAIPDTLTAQQTFEPDGPRRYVSFFKDQKLFLLVCDNVQHLPPPFSHIRLHPGKVIKGKEPAGRKWVDVVMSFNGDNTRLIPGKPMLIPDGRDGINWEDGEKWFLLLVGASIVHSDNNVDPAGVDGMDLTGDEGRPGNRKSGNTAGEEPEFKIDCILYRK